MLNATVQKVEVETKTGNAAKTGKPYSIREQIVMLSMPNGELRLHKLTLEDNAEPLAVGKYAPGARAVYVDGYNLVVSSRARDWVKAA